MNDEHKLSSIRVVFTNGTTEVFKNVENFRLDEQVMRLSIPGHMYYTQILLDKVVYFEEVLDDKTYCTDGAVYKEEKHD